MAGTLRQLLDQDVRWFKDDGRPTPEYYEYTRRLDTIARSVVNEPNQVDFSEIVLIRHAGTPVIGEPLAVTYQFPGAALSASTTKLYANYSQRQLIFARWVFIWNPNAPTGVNTSGRLIHFDDGPANLVEIARFERNTYTSPIVDAVDITTSFNALLSGAAIKNLGHQTYGNGTNGPSIYGSVIELVWG